MNRCYRCSDIMVMVALVFSFVVVGPQPLALMAVWGQAESCWGPGQAVAGAPVKSRKTLAHLEQLYGKGKVTILIDKNVGPENILLYRIGGLQKIQFDTYTGDAYEGLEGESLPVSVGLLKSQPKLVGLLKQAIAKDRITAAVCCEVVADGSWMDMEAVLGPIEASSSKGRPAGKLASSKIRD